MSTNKISNLSKRNMILSYLQIFKDDKLSESFIKENPTLKNEKVEILYQVFKLIEQNKTKEALEFIDNEANSSNKLFDISPILKYLYLCDIVLTDDDKEKNQKILDILKLLTEEDFGVIPRQDYVSLAFTKNKNLITENKKLVKSRLEYLIKEKNDSLVNCYSLIENSQKEFNKKLNVKLLASIDSLHEEEISLLTFSNCKNYLLSVTKGKTIVCFKVEKNKFSPTSAELKVLSINSIHTSDITNASWNDDSSLIVTTSKDKTIKIVNPFLGKIVQTLKSHTEIVSCALFIDNKIISAGLDKRILIWQKEMNGLYTLHETINTEVINNMLYNKELNLLILHAASINSLLFYCCKRSLVINKISFDDAIISFSLSKYINGLKLLVNYSKVSPVLDLYSINFSDEALSFQLIRKYFGHRQESFFIKCSFSENDKFILCGSDNTYFHIWKTNKSLPEQSVKGHTGAVNCVKMIEIEGNDYIFTASDDHRINIYHCLDS